MSEPVSIPPLKWRLFPVMAERGVRSASELRRRLAAVGVNLSSAQISRIVFERPQRLNMELLDALVMVLECRVCDLLQGDEACGKAAPAQAVGAPPATTTGAVSGGQMKSRRKKQPESELKRLVGPKVTPLPKRSE